MELGTRYSHASEVFNPDLLRIGVLRWGHGQDYDPYPTVWRDWGKAVESATSIESDPVIKDLIRPMPDELSRHGLVLWVSGPQFQSWTSAQRVALRNWVLLGGGMLLVIGSEGLKALPDRNEEAEHARLRWEMEQIFEGKRLEPIPFNHAVFRAFYLVKQLGGVLQRGRTLEGIKIGERYGVIYCRNDLLGTLLRDREGRYLLSCYPGGENQRKESFKLLVNLVVYSLTGTYKQDAIHSPFIEQKLRRQ
ncbi:MAG: DUF4159 domain-containing protein [Elusimicrobia bacterium]|nr:DUF4159 domain-containing protein [Elusimicrobiota bacterium]